MPGLAEPGTGKMTDLRPDEGRDPGWQVIVWNDPVNLMSYVVHVFQRVLGFSAARARRHMLEVHHQGKSCVARESREKAELYWQQLQLRGLKTTIERPD